MHHVESMLHNPVPFGASGQSITDRFNAAKHSLAGSQLGKVVCKATTEEVMGPKKKHLDYLLHCTHEPNISIPQLANLLIERVQNEHWAVSLKALITLHNLMCYGNERFMQYLASCNAKFEMQQFSDAGTQAGVDMCAHVRNYGGYITEKIATYRMVAFDFCKVKRGRDDGLMRAMDAENLLKTMPILQGQIDALLTFKVTTGDLTNGVINSAFILLFRDLIRLFACYNDGIINLLEKYFDMNKKQCRTGLDMYKQFVKRMEVVAGFLNVAESVGIDRGEIPDLAQAPASLMRALVPVPDPVKVWDCSLEDHLATLEGRPTSKDKVKELEKDAKSFEKVERKEKEKKGGKPPPRPNAAPQRPPPPPAKSKLTPEGSDEEEDEDKEETESIREIPRVKKTAGKKAAAAPPPRPSYTPQPPTDDEQEEEEQPDEPVHAPIQTQPMHSFNPFATADDDQPAARSPSPPRSPSHSGTPPPSPPVPRQTRRSKSPAVPARPVRPSPQRHAAEAPKRPAAPAKKAPPMPAVQPDLIDDLLGLGDDWTPPPGSSPAPTAATVVHDSQEEDEEEEEEEDVQPVNMQQNGVPNIFEAYQPSESYGEPEHVVDVLETSDGSPGGAGFNPFLAEADDSTPVPPTTINPFADYQQPASKPKAKSKSRPPLPTYDVSDSEEHEQEPERDAALFNPFASLTSNPTNNSGVAAAQRSMLLVASRSPSPPTPTPVLTGGMEAPDLANPFFAAAAAAQDKANKLSKGTKKGKPARPPPASAGPPNIYDQTPFCGIDLRTEDSRSPSLTRHDGRAPSRPPAPHRDSVASSGVGPPSRPPPPGSSGRASRASGTGTDSPMVARAHSPPQQQPKPPVTAGGKKKTKAKTQKPADDFGDFDPFSSILNAAAQPQQPPPQTFVSSKPKPKQKVITNDLETSLMSLCDNLDFTMKDKKGAAKPVQPGRTAQPEVLNSKMTAPTTIADNEQSLL